MNAFHASLLNAPLLFSESWSQQALPFFHQLLSSGATPATQSLTPAAPRVQLVEQSAAGALPVMARALDYRAALGAGSMSAGMVAVVYLTGPLIRYSYWSAGTEDYRLLVETLLATTEIAGIVLVIDSPGGQAAGIAGLYDTIALADKPIIALVNGLAASAGYYAVAGATEIWASQPSDQIGSIGAYITLLDASKAYEQYGYKLIEVYARVSSQKNLPVRAALNGDAGPLQDMLDELVGFFHQAVRDGRGQTLAAVSADTPAADNPFEGGVFFAQKALSLGLIDQIGSLNQAVARVQSLIAGGYTNERSAKAHSSTSFSTNPDSHDMALFDKQPLLTALRGVAADAITDDAVEAINASLTEQGIAGAFLSQAQIARLEALENTNATLTTENARLTTEVTRLGSQAGEKPSALVKEQEATPAAAASADANPFYSEADAELKKMKTALQ